MPSDSAFFHVLSLSEGSSMPFTLIAEFARFVTKPASALQIMLRDATALELATTLVYKS